MADKPRRKPWHYHSLAEWHDRLFSTLTDEQKISVLLDYEDQGRIDMQGGYPAQWALEDGKVIIATINSANSNGNEPELIIKPVAEYIAEQLEWFEDYGDESYAPLGVLQLCPLPPARG